MSIDDSTNRRTFWKTIVLILGIATFFVLGPLIFLGIPAKRDFLEHFHIALTFFKSISAGDLMPSWPADVNGGYGDISVRIYPPGLSILWAAARLLTGSWYWAAAIVFGVLTFLGGLGTYMWAREFVAPKFAVWAGVLFIVTPYHVTELFTASLLAEYAALCILPFAFAFTERICRHGSLRDIAGLGAAFALLVLFNLPLTVIGSYSLLLYLAITVDWSRIVESSVRFVAGLGLGLLCSAFYWVTVVAELPWMRPDTEHPFSTVNFVFSTLRYSEQDSGVWYANLVLLTTFAIMVPAVVLLSKKYQGNNKRLLWVVGSVTVFAFFMSTLASYPLWAVLPRLKEVQLPWRWLAVSSIGAPILLAASIPAWLQIARGKGRPLALLAIGCVLLSISFTVSHPIREARYLTPSQLHTLSINVIGTATIGQWFPLWAKGEPVEMPNEIVAEGRKAAITDWSPEHRTYSIGEGSNLESRIRTYYYPLWIATASGKQLPTRPASDGALLVDLPPEATVVNLDFREPPRSLISAVISGFGWLLLLLSALSRKQKALGNSLSDGDNDQLSTARDIAKDLL